MLSSPSKRRYLREIYDYLNGLPGLPIANFRSKDPFWQPLNRSNRMKDMIQDKSGGISVATSHWLRTVYALKLKGNSSVCWIRCSSLGRKFKVSSVSLSRGKISRDVPVRGQEQGWPARSGKQMQTCSQHICERARTRKWVDLRDSSVYLDGHRTRQLRGSFVFCKVIRVFSVKVKLYNRLRIRQLQKSKYIITWFKKEPQRTAIVIWFCCILFQHSWNKLNV